jgi:hypothetical protein
MDYNSQFFLLCWVYIFFDSLDSVKVECALVGFNIPPPPKQLLSSTPKKSSSPLSSTPNTPIPVLQHNVIYHLMDQIKDRLRGMMQPDYREDVVGEAQVLKIFGYNAGKDRVVGCRVEKGVLARTMQAATLESSILKKV